MVCLPHFKSFCHKIMLVIGFFDFVLRLKGSDSHASVPECRSIRHAIRAFSCLLMICLSQPATATSVSFEWSPNPESNVSGYLLSYGNTLGNYSNSVRAGTMPSATVSGLQEGVTYYFVLAAINTAGLLGAPSEVLSYFVPVTTPVNRSPVAFPSSLAMLEDASLNFVLTGTDPDNDPITYAVVKAPGKGSLSGTTPNLRYTPNADVNGTDSFTFRIFDGKTHSTAATVSINISSVNDAPIAKSRSITTHKNTAFPIILSGADKDSFTLRYSVVSNPASGKLAGTAPNITYTPNNNFVGSDQLTFLVNDGTLNSTPATISILVAQTGNIPTTPANVPPVFAGSPFYAADANEGILYSGQTIANQATDSQPISYWKVSGPAWLNVATDGTLSGTPPFGSSGVNAFHIRAADPSSLTADAELRINVTWLPVPWQTGNVGIGPLAGSVTYGAGTFTQTGSGIINRTKDRFRYTFQRLSGDGEIIAKVGPMPDHGTWARVGVMIRASLGPNSRHVFFGLTNPTSYRLASRSNGGGKTITKNSTSSAGTDTWVRLIRTGRKINSYRSDNGINWTFSGAANVKMAQECYIGLAVASGGTAVDFTAQFSNVYVVP
jgi:Bacterial Ig domain/Fibronectin type III domain/Putative Ig domain